MDDMIGLDFSIPANNQKIIEIYNKLRSLQLVVNKDYQRKLVWKKQHKINFIDTILKNYPFPEVYLTPGALDQEKLILIDEIVDGQQRLTTIRDYIEELDVFSLPDLSIQKFSELNVTQRSSFLSYEVSVRYLKNVTAEQVREIFQRINKTDYALNSTERINAQWGYSEFVCFAKQLIEESFESESVVYRLEESVRKEFVDFFNGNDKDDVAVFSELDVTRMLALQYIMTLIVTIDGGKYFARNDKIKGYIEGYNDNFPQAPDIAERLLAIIKIIKATGIKRTSRWYNKANLFSLIVELDKVELIEIDPISMGEILKDLDRKASIDEFGILFEGHFEGGRLTAEEKRYFDYAREAVNQRAARDYRGQFISNIIQASSTSQVQSPPP